jgi:hypothetical protein
VRDKDISPTTHAPVAGESPAVSQEVIDKGAPVPRLRPVPPAQSTQDSGTATGVPSSGGARGGQTGDPGTPGGGRSKK